MRPVLGAVLELACCGVIVEGRRTWHKRQRIAEAAWFCLIWKQGKLEAALCKLTKEPREMLKVQAAGRTDAGVHARGQVGAGDVGQGGVHLCKRAGCWPHGRRGHTLVARGGTMCK